ncbi:hypothetical protein [Pseudophaeobacter leonis]|uniref:hypothetical protein n=1 Tax=Pseudophaeobacter leonis TaxID=1144477 RepID=UPI0009F5D721|nr:hypothetical protein [Pseudophaeobacter leonis]
MILEIRRYTLHPGQRETLKDALYDGPVWTKEVEPQVMPLIAHYEASVVETTQGFEGFRETPDL